MSAPESRGDRLDALAKKKGLDALVVTNLHDIRWLTGFTGSNAVVVVGRDSEGDPVRRFITDFRYVAQAEDQVPEPWQRIDGGRDLGGAGLAAHLPHGVKKVGFDDAQLTVAAHRRLKNAVEIGQELVPAQGLVSGLRAVKDPSELSAIRAASELADAAFVEVVLEGGVVGRTERELGLRLETRLRELGASGNSFDPIVAFGAHGALPHASPRDEVIPKDVLLTVDWGCILDGYCSDCTRTVATGTVGDEARGVYELVLDAQKQSLAAVKAGADARAIDKVAREIIAAGGHGDHFGHGLGHGVGLEVHEAPTLSPRGQGALVAGQIVTVEPGVYVPGHHGVRIEDLVAVTDDGSDVFTTVSKDLIEVS
ncbi:M24 family metallopeptidase [Patulibacter minatonensis]|uniref:M24 family metallopeptidase n=1 Tax=Patulibacter minatonensis TaxID=298163 RepID=UPI00047CE030|nr:Xaa-Pro peptidase family protein [Patulibacter minatonensis]